MVKQRVLFVCIHNSARSQMAEAWLRHLAPERFDVVSAGLEPGRLNPFAIRAMQECNIDMSLHYPKSVDELAASGRSFDYVIAVCDREAAERCPLVPGGGKKLHWTFPDPSSAQGSDQEKLVFTCHIRDLIKEKILAWL
jgi:arsenate reductase